MMFLDVLSEKCTIINKNNDTKYTITFECEDFPLTGCFIFVTGINKFFKFDFCFVLNMQFKLINLYYFSLFGTRNLSNDDSILSLCTNTKTELPTNCRFQVHIRLNHDLNDNDHYLFINLYLFKIC